MTEQDSTINPTEIGRHLMRVRDRAGVKQAELAKRVALSPAVLSRIESGDRAVTLQEGDDILAQIGTPEAADLAKALQRVWRVLQRPPLDHPDQDLLWEAEQVAIELVTLRDLPETPHAFERRLTEYIEELRRGSDLLLKREHQVAFIGSIGVGKSTAICRMTGLETPREDGTLVPVSLRVAPIHDEDNTIVGASEVDREVPEQKQALAAVMPSPKEISVTLG